MKRMISVFFVIALVWGSCVHAAPEVEWEKRSLSDTEMAKITEAYREFQGAVTYEWKTPGKSNMVTCHIMPVKAFAHGMSILMGAIVRASTPDGAPLPEKENAFEKECIHKIGSLPDQELRELINSRYSEKGTGV